MDCLDGLQELDSNSIDTIITDPPYGLHFMGKKWDYSIPSVEIWEECLRVLKPGGTLLCFAGSRTQHRMAVNVEDAGFILKDCIMWLYGSGFPKATDISKQLDNVIGKQGKGFKTAGDDGRKAEFKQDKSFRSDYGYKWKPEGEEAKLWDGWKSHGLKPAYEPILVAMKPNDGSYANNALVWGVSGLNIDGCRISHNEPVKTTNRQQRKAGWNPDTCGFDSTKNITASASPEGRYPSNVILDEVSAKMLDEQSGISTSSGGRSYQNTNDMYSGGWEHKGTGINKDPGFGDKGGASRFFYCAKASKSERNAGLSGLEKKQRDLIRKHGQAGTDNPYNRGAVKLTNHHPTVKPLSLMEYLCTITKTPTGGIVLDPFIGSGTTAIACRRVNRHFIGFEIDKNYYNISLKRLLNVPKRLDSFGTKIVSQN